MSFEGWLHRLHIKMGGFLQNFRADDYLIEVNDATVTRYVLQKAVEIAMLGLPDECNAICEVLAEHDHFDLGAADLAFQCIYLYTDLQPPATKNAVWIPSERDVRHREVQSRIAIRPLPAWLDWNAIDVDGLNKIQKLASTSRKLPRSGSWTGSLAMRGSAEYAAAMHMASELNRPDAIANMMPIMACRIHACQQANLLTTVPVIWTKYLLTGWLRENLGLAEASVRRYARHVLETAKTRFENGPLRPEQICPGFTTRQLLEVVEENTISSPGYASSWAYVKSDRGEDSHGSLSGLPERWSDNTTRSIRHSGATADQITEAEARLGQSLPADLVDFLRYTNGCDGVRDGDDHYRLRLPSLDQLFFEDAEYMASYSMEVVPKLPSHLKVDWPGIDDGAIAMYKHDGQGTQYTWILGTNAIEKSRGRLQDAYDKATIEDRAVINRYIDYWYGNRQTYDEMTNYCYLDVRWGHGTTAIYPTFKSYLASIACKSRHFEERSPLKMTYDN